MLEGKHNNNNQLITDLSEYYDLNGITVNGELFKLYDNDVKYTYTIKKKITRVDYFELILYLKN